MNYKKYLWIILSLALITKPSFTKAFDTPITGLDSLSGENFTAEVKRLFHAIRHSYDEKMQMRVTRQIFDRTAERGNERAHMYSLAYRGLLGKPLCLDYMRAALGLTDKYNECDLAGQIYDAISAYYLQHARYDSAMFYLLKSADMYKKVENANLENIQHRIGDIYYRARLYDQASQVYGDILSHYNTPEKWNFWRPYVLLNNLGQIALRAKDYALAQRHFTQSLNFQKRYLRGLLTFDYLTTVNLRLVETSYLSGRTKEAYKYLKNAASCPPDSVSDYVKAELFYWKSLIDYRDGDFMGARAKANKLFAAAGDQRISLKFMIDAYLLSSKIYTAMGDSISAFQNLNTSMALSDSLQRIGNMTRAMVLLAKRKHAQTKNILSIVQSERNTLFLILIIFITLTPIVFFLIWRRYRRKRNNRNKPVRHASVPAEKNNARVPIPYDAEKMQKLVKRFEDLCREKKIYLDHNITIQKIAEQLSSNRTYLSKSINSTLNVSFTAYINALRVEAFISKISDGEADRFTFDGIAMQCGFGNRNAFCNAFKRHTGFTPSEFFKNNGKNNINQSALNAPTDNI